MAILRNKTQNSFTVVNNAILKNKALNLKTRGLLITMLSLPDNWDFSVKGLMAILPDGQRAITSGLKELEELGYLQRTRTKNEKGHFADVIWEIYEEPRNIKEQKPQMQNADVVNDDVDFRDVETEPQSNTNISNTNTYNTNCIKNPSINQSWKMDKTEELTFLMGADNLKKPIEKDLFQLCLDIINSSEDSIKIGKSVIPLSIFQARIKKLDHSSLSAIADNLEQQRHTIKNLKAYMLRALYDFGVTENLYYTNMVRVDGF